MNWLRSNWMIILAVEVVMFVAFVYVTLQDENPDFFGMLAAFVAVSVVTLLVFALMTFLSSLFSKFIDAIFGK